MEVGSSLQDQRILIIEDNLVIAMDVQALLREAGSFAIIASHIEGACVAAETELFDVAFLDVDVAGVDSFVVAEILERRGIPYLFTTAHDSGKLPARYRLKPVLYKPYAIEELLEAVSVTLAAATQR